MSQRSYRRLTRFLFLLLFAVFLLLYLLLQGQQGERVITGGNKNTWVERNLALGEVLVNEIKSSGFIIDQFPIPAASAPGAADFNQNVIACAATVRNDGIAAVDVSISIHSTEQTAEGLKTPGLCGGFYHYGGKSDPAAKGYAALLADSAAQWQVLPRKEKGLALYLSGTQWPLSFRLEPEEVRHLVLFFWVDAEVKPTVTDLDRDGYSVTVKLTSRTAMA